MSQSKSLSLDSVIQHLPPKDLHRYLLNRLDFSTLKAARCVNKLWQSLIDPLMEFQVELSDSTKTYVEAFGSSRPVSSLNTTVFQSKYPSQGVSLQAKMLRVTVNILDGNESFQEYRRRNYSRNNLKKKHIGVTQINFRRLIYDFGYVKKFHIASLAVKSFTDSRQQLSRVYLPNVQEMIITFFDGGFHQLLPFMKNYFPKLNSVNIANVAENRSDRPLLYSWIFGFVGRHRATLDEVSLILPEGMLNDSSNGEGVVPSAVHENFLSLPRRINIRSDLRHDLKVSSNIYNDLKRRLESLSTLKRLIWDTGMLEGHRRYNLGTILLSAQTKLVELHVDNLHLKDLSLWNNIGQLLPNVSTTLEYLSLGGCFCGPPATILGVFVFSCSWLKNCHRLKTLEMVVCGISVDSIEELPYQSIKVLNLGHMLIQDQIEYVARHMINLESWILPQRGCLVNILVPKINRYLFEAILHLPKLTKLSLFAECTEKEEILNFIRTQHGIHRCGNDFECPEERTGNMRFHVDRDVFLVEHSKLEQFIQHNRVNSVDQVNRAEAVEFFIRNIIAGRVAYEVDELDDFNEDDLVFWDDAQNEIIGLNEFFIL